MTGRIIRYFWASAALTVVLLAIVGYALVTQDVAALSAIPTLLASVWVGNQAIALFTVRKPVNENDALRSYKSVFNAIIASGILLLLGALLVVFLSSAVGLVAAYVVLLAAEIALGIGGMRAIAAVYPSCAKSWG